MEQTKSEKSRLWTLFKTCFIISTCTFGGGMVIISMLQKKFRSLEALGKLLANGLLDHSGARETD